MRVDLTDTAGANRVKVRRDAAIQALMTQDPASIAQWIEANVNNMDDAKELLKRVTVMVSVLAQREFPDW